MKPACMKNTRNAVTSTHTVLIGLTKSFAWWATWPNGRRSGRRFEEEGEALHDAQQRHDPEHLAAQDHSHYASGLRVPQPPESFSHGSGPYKERVKRPFAACFVIVNWGG